MITKYISLTVFLGGLNEAMYKKALCSLRSSGNITIVAQEMWLLSYERVGS